MKLFTRILLTVSIVLFYACGNEGTQYHELTNLTPGGSLRTLFADQTKDSVRIVSTEKFSLIPSAEWIESKYETIEFPKGRVFVDTIIPITIGVNTTDVSRTAKLTITSTYKNYSIGVGYTQLGVLNISYPVAKRDADGNYFFHHINSANTIRDSISFTTYSNWSLTVEENSWCRLSEDTIRGNAGRNVIYYNMVRNTTTESRETSFMLRSNGATTEIKMLQNKPN